MTSTRPVIALALALPIALACPTQKVPVPQVPAQVGSTQPAGPAYAPAEGLETLAGEILGRADGWRGTIALRADVLDGTAEPPGAATSASNTTCVAHVRWGPPPRDSRPPPPGERAKVLATRTFPLEGAPEGGATLRLSQTAAGASFELRAGPHLRLTRPCGDPEADPLARALRALDDHALVVSPLGRTARALLRSEEALAPATLVAVLEPASSSVDAAGSGRAFRVRLIEQRPFVARVQEAERPLPEGAALVMGSLTARLGAGAEVALPEGMDATDPALALMLPDGLRVPVR